MPRSLPSFSVMHSGTWGIPNCRWSVLDVFIARTAPKPRFCFLRGWERCGLEPELCAWGCCHSSPRAGGFEDSAEGGITSFWTCGKMTVRTIAEQEAFTGVVLGQSRALPS